MYTAHTFNKDAFTMTEITEEKNHMQRNNGSVFTLVLFVLCFQFDISFFSSHLASVVL